MSLIAEDLKKFMDDRTVEFKRLEGYIDGNIKEYYRAELEVNKLAIEAYLAQGERKRWMERALRAEKQLVAHQDKELELDGCGCDYCAKVEE